MEHIAALLLLIGCSKDLSQCGELPAPVTVFETMEECESIRPQVAGVWKDKTPRLFSRCLYVDPAAEEADAELVWEVKPDGTLDASVLFGAQLASGSDFTQKNNVLKE